MKIGRIAALGESAGYTFDESDDDDENDGEYAAKQTTGSRRRQHACVQCRWRFFIINIIT